MQTKYNIGSSEFPPVVLLNGGIVARSLGSQGIPVYALDNSENFGRFSKYSKLIRFGAKGIEEQVEWLTNNGLEQVKGSVIFPCSDKTIELVSKHRKQLSEHYILPESKDDLMLAMLDKAATYDLANKIGVPTPKTWCVNSKEDLECILKEISYPCGLKPRYSYEYKGRNFLKKLFIVNNQDELISEFQELTELGRKYKFRSDLIVTEIIPGVGPTQFQSYYSYLDENGTPLMHFTKRKLRQYPIDSGNGTYHLTDWNPEVAELGLKFMKGVGYLGLGAIEFKQDPRDGVLKIMECNPRFTNATELIRRSGFDMALFVYNRLVGKELPPYENYRKGVSMIRPVRDFLAFREIHKKDKVSWNSWFRSIARKHYFELLSWKDPKPWLMMGVYYIKRVLGFESKNKSQ